MEDNQFNQNPNTSLTTAMILFITSFTILIALSVMLYMIAYYIVLLGVR